MTGNLCERWSHVEVLDCIFFFSNLAVQDSVYWLSLGKHSFLFYL